MREASSATRDRVRELVCARTSVRPRCPCRSGALITHGKPIRSRPDRFLGAGADLVRGLRDPRLGEALALPQLRGRERRSLAARAGAAARAVRRCARRSRPASRCPARSGRRLARRRPAARCPARPRSRRSRAGRRSGSRAQTDPGRARSRGAHARARRRAARAGPAPRLGRGDACPGLALEDPPPPRLILAVPRDRCARDLPRMTCAPSSR